MDDFELVVARNLQHLLGLLATYPDARLIAGASDFIPFMRTGKWRPRLAIDISRVDELRGCRAVDGWLEMGPLVTHGELATSPLVLEKARALAEAAAAVADSQIRNRATLGGNICTASPAADSVPALAVLDAELVLLSQYGERRMPLAAFLVGPGKTALRPGEVLAKVRCAVPPEQAGSAFLKLGRRKAMAISLANAAAFVRVESGHILEARLALGAVAPTVVRCAAVEAHLANKRANGGSLAAATSLVSGAISPIDDVRASAGYRRSVAVELAYRALAQASERAGQSS